MRLMSAASVLVILLTSVLAVSPVEALPDPYNPWHDVTETSCRDGTPQLLVEAWGLDDPMDARRGFPSPRPVDGGLVESVMGLYDALGLAAEQALAGPNYPVLSFGVERPVVAMVDAVAEAIRWHRLAELHPEDRPRYLARAALTMLTASEAITPWVEAAVERDEWPDSPAIADPLGLIRIGGTGDDIEVRERVILIDPRGDDLYLGPVARADPLRYAPILPYPVPGHRVASPVSIAIDFAGNDFHQTKYGSTVAAADGGVAVFDERGGDDTYFVGSRSIGSSDGGVALFLERGGNDTYAPFRNDHWLRGLSSALGDATHRGFALAMDFGGNDTYDLGDESAGVSWVGLIEEAPGTTIGVFCDLSGTDRYTTHARRVLGFGTGRDSLAMFADLGEAEDEYTHNSYWNLPSATNAARWRDGYDGANGYGLDDG